LPDFDLSRYAFSECRFTETVSEPWAGISATFDPDGVRRQLQDRFDAVPVFLDEGLAEKHYNGFSSQ
jgi:hypothetical protein